jgi:hypothetical protein
MKKISFLITLSVLIVSCARLPDIMPDTDGMRDGTILSCNNLFPQGRWQLTHTIEAIVPGGKKSGLVGASVISSHDRSVQCALMTIEGFVLFSGRYDGKLIVERAVTPFDRPGFAEGLMNDLILLFLKPAAPLKKTGFVDGIRVCRFISPTDGAIDVLIGKGQAWQVHKYSPRHKLERTIEARGRGWGLVDKTEGGFFAKNMTLRRHGILGYQLDLQLVEAIPLP